MSAFAIPAGAAVGHAPALITDDAIPVARIGWIAAVLFFGVFLGWAALLRLDAAAQGTGSISVAGNRQVVQHREGGVVRALHVREGQRVRAGEVLIDLADGDALATERSLFAQMVRLESERARLLAERAGGGIVEPAAFAALNGQDRAAAAAALAQAHVELGARRAALADQKRVLLQQSAQVRAEIGGIGHRIALTVDQGRLYEEELEGVRAMAERGYVSRNRVRAVEHEQADMKGQTAQLAASAASAREQIGEKRMQALTLDSAASERVSSELHQADLSLGDVIPKYRAAREQLERTHIRATASGQVVGLAVFTVGGVTAPGQTLMSIVPDAAPLVIEAQFSPEEANDLRVGRHADVRVGAFHDRGAAPLSGTISRLSADSFKDDKTGVVYYTATISVPAAEVAALDRREGADALKPGLPVQVMVPLRRRTLLQYLLEPLDHALWQGLHEQ